LSILRKSVDWQARCRHEARSQAYNKLKNHDLSHTCLILIKNQTRSRASWQRACRHGQPPKQARPSRLFFRNPLAIAGLVFGSHWRPHRRGPARPAYTPLQPGRPCPCGSPLLWGWTRPGVTLPGMGRWAAVLPRFLQLLAGRPHARPFSCLKLTSGFTRSKTVMTRP
jgi:hypothetical protein